MSLTMLAHECDNRRLLGDRGSALSQEPCDVAVGFVVGLFGPLTTEQLQSLESFRESKSRLNDRGHLFKIHV